MLRVEYEATESLPPGQLVDITESRGRVDVKIRQDADAHEYTAALNVALKLFLADCNWFQIWRGRVISAHSPDSPLTVEYQVDDQIDRRKCVEVRESCGHVVVHVARSATVADFVNAINPSTEAFLAGGQWFQLWQGEIITMDSPGSAAA
ncbi:hypothetical protein [Streptomyces azureus]|uniref:Protein translocase subunit SecY n=1 Tax=Streptomyces azureus TaxID=146537 RepID=A0A0K8PGD6_STRAJ|nr:hypothetical protein [Streptomyces azureus]GAP46946.1 protein translocase subunit SecY [Streptomyces azureus]